MKTDGTMSTAEVAAYVGISLRQMYHWVEREWVWPKGQVWDGDSRRPNLRWTEKDAARVLAHKRLMDAGLSGEAALEVLSQSLRGGWLTDHVKVTVTP